MKTTLVESVPATWDDARDGTFFRLVADLFHPDVLLGATVLLASYDADEFSSCTSPTPRTTVYAASAS